MVSDSELRGAVLGTWRLVDIHEVYADGTIAKPFGDNPRGYLAYASGRIG